MNYYRVLAEFEESTHERMMVDLGVRVLAPKLNIPKVPVRFITPSYDGEFQEEKPILGLARGRREIFLLAGLSDHELISTLAHEVRHIFQVVTGRYCLDMEIRERDARLWALELNPPRTGPEIRRWLWEEEAFQKNPGLRETFQRVDELMMAARQAPTHTAPEVRRIEYAASRPERRIAANKQERIDYIRKLLGQLPMTASYQGQRSRLNEELTELTRGVAA